MWFDAAVLRSLCAVVLGFLTMRAVPALAYPQWQLTAGAVRCNQCHFAPAGGGLLTSYGRDANSDDLSTFPGEGAFLNGKVRLPTWPALGGDLRGAYAAQDAQDPDGAHQAVFPMQADAYGRAGFGSFSAYVSAGLRGQSRANKDLATDFARALADVAT